jgi:hypothetical protein
VILASPVAQAAQRAAIRQQFGTGGAVNRAVDSTAAQKRVIRRIDDGVHRQRGDVAVNGDEQHGQGVPGDRASRATRATL